MLLAEVRRCPGVRTAVFLDFSAPRKDFEHLYYVALRSYWVREIFSKSRIGEHQKIFCSRHIVERFNVRQSDCGKYYGYFSGWCMQYEPPTLLFVSLPIVMVYYIVVSIRGFAADQTRTWTAPLTK